MIDVFSALYSSYKMTIGLYKVSPLIKKNERGAGILTESGVLGMKCSN
jgi:hypothetical protein